MEKVKVEVTRLPFSSVLKKIDSREKYDIEMLRFLWQLSLEENYKRTDYIETEFKIKLWEQYSGYGRERLLLEKIIGKNLF
jgi:hypothetical protein